jgi:phospholipid-binding lipoprotein MlaA
MNAPKRNIASMLVLCTEVLAGCAVTPSKVDPLEPWNRAMYSVHTAVDDAVIKPVAKAYVEIWPEPIRTGVSNFFGNIDDFFTGVNDVLQGRGDRAGDAFGRVMLNSTFGMGGILDLASMMGIAKDRNDFGLTFGKWGAPQGAYLFVPLFGPTTVRDGPASSYGSISARLGISTILLFVIHSTGSSISIPARKRFRPRVSSTPPPSTGIAICATRT